MSIVFTYHGDSLQVGPTLPAQADTAVSVADGAASSAMDEAGLCRIASETASLVRISPSAIDGTGGEYWPAGHVEVRYLAAGDKIGVSAG